MFAFLMAITLAAEAPPANPVLGKAGEPATVAEAQMLIEKTKQEIAEEEKSWSEETAREKEAETRRKKRFSDFNQDKLRLQQSLADQEQTLKGLLAKMEGHQLRTKELEARFRQLNLAIGGQAKLLRADLALGLPYQLEKREESLDLLVRDIAGGEISPEEAFNRLWVFYQNQSRMAQEAEVYSGDFNEEGGDPVQVKYLRVGRQCLAFTSLDGNKLGILKKTGPGQYQWVRENDLDYSARQAIKEAIATAEGQRVPGFVPLPLWRESFASDLASDAQTAAASVNATSQSEQPVASVTPVAKAATKLGTKTKSSSKPSTHSEGAQ